MRLLQHQFVEMEVNIGNEKAGTIVIEVRRPSPCSGTSFDSQSLTPFPPH